MTAQQYRATIERLGLSQVDAGKFLGVTTRSSWAWANGKTPIPLAVQILLKYMATKNLTPADMIPHK